MTGDDSGRFVGVRLIGMVFAIPFGVAQMRQKGIDYEDTRKAAYRQRMRD